MTGGLSDLDELLEGQAFLRNQIEEWTKINNQVQDPTGFAQTQLANLERVYNLITGKIQTEEKFGTAPANPNVQ